MDAVRSLHVLVELVDKTTAPLRNINRAVDNVKRNTQGLVDRVNELRGQLLMLGSGLAAIGYGGFRFFKGATEDLADFQDALRVFRNYAGENAEAILKAMEEAAAGTIDSTQMILNANRAIVMGIDPEFLPEMMKIARAAARAMGTDVQYMFESIAVGTARQSKLILDNLGIIIDAEAAYKKYAQSIGKTAEQLTEAEKRQAFLTAVMESGRKLVDKVDLSQETLNETVAKARVAWTEFKKELAEGALPVIELLLKSLKKVTSWLNDLPKSAKAAVGVFGVLTTLVAGLSGPLMINVAAFAYLRKQISTLTGITPLIGALRAAIIGLTRAFWPLALVTTLLYMFKKAYDANFLGMQEKLKEVWRLAKAIFGALKVVFSAFWATVKDTFTPIVDLLREFGLIGRDAGKSFRGYFQPVIDWLNANKETLREFGKVLGWVATLGLRVLIFTIYVLVKALKKLNEVASAVREKIEPIMKIASYAIPGIGGFRLAGEVLRGLEIKPTQPVLPSPAELVPAPQPATVVVRESRVEHRTMNVPKIEIKVEGAGDPEKVAERVEKRLLRQFRAYGL